MVPTGPAAPRGQVGHLVPAVLLEVVTLHAADGLGSLAAHHDHHLRSHGGTLGHSDTGGVGSGPTCACVLGYLWDADGRSRSGPVRLDEVPLVGGQQVILHCFYQEIFTGVVVLDQSFFLHILKASGRRSRSTQPT